MVKLEETINRICNELVTMQCTFAQANERILLAVRESGMVELAENQAIENPFPQPPEPTRQLTETENVIWCAADSRFTGWDCCANAIKHPVPIGNGKQTRWVKIVEDIPDKVKTGEKK